MTFKIRNSRNNKRPDFYTDINRKNMSDFGLLLFFLLFYGPFLYLCRNLIGFHRIVWGFIFYIFFGIGVVVIISIYNIIYFWKKNKKCQNSDLFSPILLYSHSINLITILYFFYPITLLDWILVITTLISLLVCPSPQKSLILQNLRFVYFTTMKGREATSDDIAKIYSILVAGVFMQGVFFILCLIQLYPIPAFILLFLQKPLEAYYKGKGYRVGLISIEERRGSNILKKRVYRNEFEKDRVFLIAVGVMVAPLAFEIFFFIFNLSIYLKPI
ncbi:MAG: hypothetical protein ACTSRS_15085 [Candidatus Helarchaeota archaeon]